MHIDLHASVILSPLLSIHKFGVSCFHIPEVTLAIPQHVIVSQIVKTLL